MYNYMLNLTVTWMVNISGVKFVQSHWRMLHKFRTQTVINQQILKNFLRILKVVTAWPYLKNRLTNAYRAHFTFQVRTMGPQSLDFHIHNTHPIKPHNRARRRTLNINNADTSRHDYVKCARAHDIEYIAVHYIHTPQWTVFVRI